MSTRAEIETRHLLALDGMPRERLINILDVAQRYLDAGLDNPTHQDLLAGRIIANVFLEDSTRTRTSFAVAAVRLGATPITLTGQGSSISKGETLGDTIDTITAMGVDAIVLRCSAAGGAQLAAQHAECPVINAGDGKHEHPTQALLDLLTMRQALGELTNKNIVIVGDIAGSRVARSNIHGLMTLGARVTLVGPPTHVPNSFTQFYNNDRVTISHDLDEALADADVVMALRVQFERGSDITGDYHDLFGLTSERIAALKPGTIIMHPGPMNRGLEIDAAVADDPQRSMIRRQVTHGVAVRMAVLSELIG